MRRFRALLAIVSTAAALVAIAPRAEAAGIVTHAWMALDAIDLVDQSDLRAVLRAHRDQVRAGAEFPDGGYWTRTLGTPGGDYGEEAHWQRFVEAYTAQIRNDPACGRLENPYGPCAPTIAHLMGTAAHGMGDEVWDWLFEPNGPGFDESYLPPDFTPFVGPGGLELQLDIVAIARHGRPVGPTPEIPDPAKIDAAFAAVGRGDIEPSALPVGENFLDVERNVEAFWAPAHIDALERAMPWTSAHMITAAGGVNFGARAIAGYYDTIWADLLGRTRRTRVSATAPYNGQVNVPATGWTHDTSPGSNPGNGGGLTRIAAALSSALPFHAQAGQGSVPSELPTDALRLRDLRTLRLVPPRPGYPRIVPYNPEAGEHVIALQPAHDLAPCRWYQVETTPSLLDARQHPVKSASWRFRTSGCRTALLPTAVHGTVACDATGAYNFAPNGAATANVSVLLTNCTGGQDGAPRHGASLPIATGVGSFRVTLPTSSCDELTTPTRPAFISGTVQWRNAHGHVIGTSDVSRQTFDLRGDVVTTARRSAALPDHSLALRIAPTPTCTLGQLATSAPISGGNVSTWPTADRR